MYRAIFFSFIWLFWGYIAKASIISGSHKTLPQAYTAALVTQPPCFVANKGQIKSQNQPVRFYCHQKNIHVYFSPGGIQFAFIVHAPGTGISEAGGSAAPDNTLPGEKELPFINYHNTMKTSVKRVALVFLSSNPATSILPLGGPGYVENYYPAGFPENPIVRIKTYRQIIYHHLYPHIDLVLTLLNTGLKYEFIVRPGGKVKDIHMQWNGLQGQPMQACAGIVYNLPDRGNLLDSGLACFQGEKEIGSRYVISGNRILFALHKYDKTQTLLIDPVIKWATYFGGDGDEEGRAIATDKDGSVYLAGWTSSSTGMATQGSNQTSFGGFYDAFLSKFSTDGELLWSTYYGGAENENGFGLTLDPSGNVYICGSTPSPGMATAGAYQTSLGGFTDAFIAKFNPAGQRIWSTYFGGPLDDQALGIATDLKGGIFITGFTLSDTGIATAGAYQSLYNGVRDKGFLARFDSSGTISWATYYGGPANDYSFAVATDLADNVVLCGTVSSHSGIATSGAFRTSVGGYYDGFLAKFSNNGRLLWGTYFGNEGDDECTAVGCDASGSIYITGNTTSTSAIATSGAHQTTYSGGTNGYDAFLAKFSKDGDLDWGTYYGGSGDDFSWGLDISPMQNIYFSGYTNSAIGIATPDAYKTTISGMQDVYVAEFDTSGQLNWGSYAGGENNDFGYAVKTDAGEHLYVTGVTSSKTGMAAGSAWSDSLSGSTDAFLIKFSPNKTAVNSHPEDVLHTEVYPSPFQNIFRVHYRLQDASRVRIELCNLEGSTIRLLSVDKESGGDHSHEFNFEKQELPPGLYVLKMIFDKGITCRKIIRY